MNQVTCQKTYQVMGGEFQFLCFPQSFLSREDVYALFEEAYQEVKRIEEKFTDFKESYFSRINSMAGVGPVDIDEETLGLIKKSHEVAENSNGVFDISFASIGHWWRAHKEEGKVLSEDFIKEHLKYIDYRLIKLDEKKKTIFLPFSQMRIGLGGIGKGYAVDRVYDLFKKRGLVNFYINGSGDIRVAAELTAPRSWRIGIRNPLSSDPKKAVGVIQLHNGAVASSGGYVHNVGGDRFNNHIIHPQTGMSAREIIGSTVLADNAITADTTATILMNLSKKEGIEYLNRRQLFGLVFCKEGKSYLSETALKHFGMEVKGPAL
nr:FAD:protein FMN transferase [Bacteriovorax sp. HI3]